MNARRHDPLSALLPLAALAVACGGGGDKPASQSISKALAPPAPAKSESKDAPAPKKKEKDPNALENPWTLDAVRAALDPGVKAVYARSGTDAKGKKAGGELTYVLRRNTDDGAGTSFTIEPDPGTNKASSMIATTPWSNLSPFFAVEKPKVEVVARESVTVPAGTFEHTAKVEITDFFGSHKTAWLIADQPGIYAKVIDHGNENDEKDRTEVVHELVRVERPAG